MRPARFLSAVSACALSAVASHALAAPITNASIIAAAGNQIQAGNGTLNLILFNAGGGGGVNGNASGSFNGDDANPGMQRATATPTLSSLTSPPLAS